MSIGYVIKLNLKYIKLDYNNRKLNNIIEELKVYIIIERYWLDKIGLVTIPIIKSYCKYIDSILLQLKDRVMYLDIREIRIYLCKLKLIDKNKIEVVRELKIQERINYI